MEKLKVEFVIRLNRASRVRISIVGEKPDAFLAPGSSQLLVPWAVGENF